MRRRGVGASAVTKKKVETARYKEHGNELAAQQLEQLSQQLETFHTNLEEFASKHKQVRLILFGPNASMMIIL